MKRKIVVSEESRKERRDRHFRIKQEREQNRVCVICGQEPSLADVRYGARCKARMQKARANNANWNRERAKTLLSNGICAKCGKYPVIEGYKHCLDCKEKSRIGQYNRRMKRISKGLCYRCGQRPICDESISACEACLRRDYLPDKTKEIRERNKDLCFAAYGGAVCACCGETTRKFLTFDHINNDGAAHRKSDPSAGNLVNWLKTNDFPEGFQVLCFNCNYGKKVNGGICPHKDPQIMPQD
jgi:hypothetical protein